MEFSARQPTKNRSVCCVYGCKSTANKNRTIRFHLFPKAGERQVLTKNKLGQEVVCDKLFAWMTALKINKVKLKRKKVVCSLHFQREDYTSNAGNKLKQYLKANAVPSCNLPAVSQPRHRISTDCPKTRNESNGNEKKSTNTKKQKISNAKELKPIKRTQKNKFVEKNRVEETAVPLEIYIKEEQLDLQEETENPAMLAYDFVQNYTSEFFLIPSSESNKHSETGPKPLEFVDISENNITEIKTEEIEITEDEEPGGQKRKICPSPVQNDENEEVKQNNVIKNTEQTEKLHAVDIFTIFGRSVADQLRSFPTDVAITVQSKIQNLIIEEYDKIYSK